MKKIVVVGGGVAAKGFLGAAFELHHDVEYTLIRRNKKGPVPCGIPYGFGTLESPEQNQSPDKSLMDHHVKMVIDDVVTIDRENMLIHTKENGQFGYDKLILATGSLPVFPNFPGKSLNNIHVIEKDVDLNVEMKSKIDSSTNIIIVGGGFIGVELADEINKLQGKNITLVELAPTVLNVAFEAEIGLEIKENLEKHGIKVLPKVGVESFEGEGKVSHVKLSNGDSLEADLVIMAIGAYPNIALAKESNLQLDERNAIFVNDYQQTSDENIYAIGDCAGKIDLFTNMVSNVRLASIAAKEGRHAALNLFNPIYKSNIKEVMNLFSTAVDGNYYAAAGMTKAQCESAGFNVLEVKVSAPNRHPGTLPGTIITQGTFFFDTKDLRLLGAQLKGNQSVAEMINIIGVILQEKGDAYHLYHYNYGTHPMGTASPNKYILHQAGLMAISTRNHH
ncbi:MAG: FAD-dependent oxidoreductase [Clostridia bacterium]|nr:FAD-dependent oxidoreductase [Clostridia bacterium]